MLAGSVGLFFRLLLVKKMGRILLTNQTKKEKPKQKRFIFDIHFKTTLKEVLIEMNG